MEYTRETYYVVLLGQVKVNSACPMMDDDDGPEVWVTLDLVVVVDLKRDNE